MDLVRWWSYRREIGADQVVVAIRDSGVGIAPDKLDQAFPPFLYNQT